MGGLQFSKSVTVFQGRTVPEEGYLAGYAAIINAYGIQIPLPSKLSLISKKNRKYENEKWRVFPFQYLPENILYKHLIFAIKYEGINLLFFKRLFGFIDNEEIISLVTAEPNGQYARRIWFLFEWLMGVNLPIPDLEKGNYVELLDEKIQFSIGSGIKSQRHRVTNNLPGTREFCPLVFKTRKLENYVDKRLSAQTEQIIQGVRKDFLQRAAAFLLLKDSKASFSIEGESPKSKRAARWGQAVGQAGMKSLSKDELYRLQQLVIENPRFIELGYRKKGGFVGEHDRVSGEPLPDHISAKWEDIESLMEGLLDTERILIDETFDPIVAATVIAFGMVNIHPFEDGNGRIHRYLIHHVLSKKKFAPQGIIFPISAAILDRINDYRTVLESYSLPLLDFIEWKETKDHNVEVLNQTIDFYRYCDLTLHAEFLYECVDETIEKIIPAEIDYLSKYDQFKSYVEEEFEMPDKLVSTLVRFLEQNSGKLSKRARENEFSLLDSKEIEEIEFTFKSIFTSE